MFFFHFNLNFSFTFLILSSSSDISLINFNFLNSYKNVLFVGLENEYQDLNKSIKNLKFYDCEDFFELASIIKSSKISKSNKFSGNLTVQYIIWSKGNKKLKKNIKKQYENAYKDLFPLSLIFSFCLNPPRELK